MTIKIIKLDDIPPTLEHELRGAYSFTEINHSSLAKNVNTDKDYTVAVANGESRLPAYLLSRFTGLKLIVIFGVGYDGIDLAYVREKGIIVANTAGVLTEDVADLAVTLALTLCREVLLAHNFVSSGQWQGSRYPLTHKFSGKKVGILGMGRVGQAICQRLAGFRCQIYYCDSRDRDVAASRLDDLNALAENVDILILSASANASNMDIIDLDILTKLGSNGLLINVARGSLVNQSDLITALNEQRIAGAALDVLKNEPEVPLGLIRKNVILTPHFASGTEETRQAMAQLVLDNISNYMKTGEVLTPVL